MHRSLLIAALSMTGCTTVGPDYVAPTVTAPAAWHAKLEAGLAGSDPDARVLARWWSMLEAPVLVALIERAVVSNRDLQQTTARVREARARAGVSAADRFPSVSVSGTATQSESSEETGSGATRELYSAGIDARWELDLFGGKRRALEAASAAVEASEEDLRDALVSLIGEVALSYIDLCALQVRLSIAEANLAAQSETFDIARWRNQAGLTTARDVEQARLNLEQTRAQLPTLRTGIAQAGHRIAILLGQQPGTLAPEWLRPQAIPTVAAAVLVGVPADTLRRRPDIRRSERQLAAQTAQIGVATAALYPSFSLAGSIGLEALTPGRLLTASALKTSIGGNAGWPLFDAGRIRQNIAVQTALQEQALGRYEATVLTALREVEDTLVAYVAEQARRDALTQAAAAARNASQLARAQYEAGLVDFQVVLDTQRSVLTLQDQVAVSEGQVVQNFVRLYKALGGGWTALSPVADLTVR
jgi:NodT family efflux transporter outer membrane factor (OMF) lipoprotein